jgi:hypothetical protein
MLEAILAGERDVETLADLARGRLRTKRDQLKDALEGRVTAHHSFLLTEHLSTLEYVDEAIARVSGEIDQRLIADQEAIALLDTIPGVGQRAAESLIAHVQGVRLNHTIFLGRRGQLGYAPVLRYDAVGKRRRQEVPHGHDSPADSSRSPLAFGPGRLTAPGGCHRD